MKSIIAVTLCVCLLLAPVAQADFATTIINACSGGMTSTMCKGVMSRANKVCAGKDGQGSCVKAAIGICQKNKKVCEQASGPLCAATGSYKSTCLTAIKTATSPVGGIAGSLLG